jgi:hypothetical protein
MLQAIVAAAGGIVGGAAAAAAVGGFLWDRSTARAVERLLSGRSAPHPRVFSREEIEGLPDPVVRYFEFALSPGQPLIRSGRFEQRAEFRIGGLDSRWKPLSAVQYVSTDPPGFVWDAALRMAPLLTVRIRDAYLAGAGAMQARVAALLPVMDQRSSPELAAGALHRYLAEAVWLPTALLPSQGIEWEAVDAGTARATLTVAGVKASLEFHFGADGAIVRAYTPARHREVDGAYLPTPWVCSYTSTAEVHGMHVPTEGEVAWILPEGRMPCWRGRISGHTYETVDKNSTGTIT